MKIIKFLSIFFLLISFSFAASANTYDLRFTSVQLSGNQYCATAQIKAQDIAFETGSATVFFTYNLKAIQKPRANALNFGTANLCNQQEAYSHSFNALEYNSDIGEGNYAIILKEKNTGCPTISNEWIDIAEFCFDVVNNSEEAKLSFNEKYTAFNTDENNGTLLTKGTFENIDAPLVSSNQSLSNAKTFTAHLSPNIITEQLSIQFTVPTISNLNITIFDRLGRVVNTKKLTAIIGQHKETFEVDDLPKGYYFLNINDSKNTVSHKFIVL